ncbi:MAG: mersacidin/lichenicidin family type 2 lantibiotic (plasmid) [Dolichospermum sp. DET50]|nr:mersacidin/lichenicidin family type 2 lantibiotic [Dolichospermum sp. DET66]MBS3035924.1 mersacidin/lichenicidin family type 2 lantibiotic [Dolichospermum sp. DET67]MBS3041092.1 mersacidin/lichenicidin family type 2 lantibiotic [Dolichospermum sp. DET50]QSX70975.1 MAG: mersacidin/lichenicidin family type 2 lantibiotic [Dolichospermum sp. DET69]
MSTNDIIRAWKDEDYRASLTEEQRLQLPENPAGLIELTDDDMSSMVGGLLAGEVHTKTCNHCCGSASAATISLA